MARGIRFCCTVLHVVQVRKHTEMRESQMKRVQFSHVLVFSDSRNVRKSVTQIIYLSPLRRGPHSWTDIFLSTPVAADFGTGPEAGRRGAQLDEEFCYAPLATDFGPGPDGAAGGRRWTRSLLFYASCRQLRAWPGWGGGGVRCLGVEFAFLSFTPWPLVTGPNTI